MKQKLKKPEKRKKAAPVAQLGLSEAVVKKFCELCSWAYVVWCIRKELFNEQAERSRLYLFGRLIHISQEYWILQVAKLHDPAVQSGRVNLTIEYVTDYGGWDEDTIRTLRGLKVKLESCLQAPAKFARNKIIAHNDLISLLESKSLGAFRSGKDEEYFETLQRFVDIVHDKVCGGPSPFDDFVESDVSEFFARLK